ncbi:hypothetical protein Tco_1070864 [Tanacetum coccineum]|uniref:Uncharacterized protein n=1 Tax=Tanacetum coccineum TaxID=301880 RepID=A0ABQ5HMP1_9ASTR
MDKHRVPPTKRLFLVTESHSLTRSLNSFVLRESVGDPGLPLVVSPLRSNASHDDIHLKVFGPSVEITQQFLMEKTLVMVDRPKETGIKYFSSGEIGTMMAPGGSFMASFEDLKSFLPMHTPSNDLIRTREEPTGATSAISVLFGQRYFKAE